MKTKIILFFLSSILFNSIVKAQSGGRIHAGINLSNITVSSSGGVNDANMLTTFQAGVTGDFYLGGPLYLQPGILYTGKGSKVESGTPGTNGYFKQTFNPYYFEIPVNLIFKTPAIGAGRFFVGAGPYLAVGVRGKTSTEGQTLLGLTYDVESDIRFSDDDPATFDEEEGAGFGIMKRFDYGLNATAGFEGRSMVLGVGYGYGLAKLQSGSDNDADKKNKHRVLSFTLGFKF